MPTPGNFENDPIRKAFDKYFDLLENASTPGRGQPEVNGAQ